MSRPQKTGRNVSRDWPWGGTPARTDAPQDLCQCIRTAVEDVGSPVTVSRLAERLQTRGGDPAYGDLHEALYRDYLQDLDAAGVLVFDMERGLVYSTESVANASDEDCST